jgi:hypothetical protein
MADSNNSIDIVVQNSVDPQIAPRLISIADGADKAASKIGSLKAQLDSLKSSGLGGLLSLLTSAEGSTSALARETEGLVTSQKSAASALNVTASALAKQTAGAKSAAAAITEQANANAVMAANSSDTAAAMAEELAMQEAINEAVAAGVVEYESIIAEAQAYSESILKMAASYELSTAAIKATTQQEQVFGATLAETTAALEAQGVIWLETFDQRRRLTTEEIVEQDQLRLATESLVSADERFAETQRLVATVMGDVISAEVRDTEAKLANAAATEALGTKIHGLTELQAASAASIVLSGVSSRRAFENFLTKTLSLGPALKAVFPIIGGVAFIEILKEAGTALYDFVRKAVDSAHNIGIAFDEAIIPLRKTNDSLAVANDKLDQTISRLEHKPTSNGAQLALDEARQAADRLDTSLQRVQGDLDKLLSKNRIGFVQSVITGQGTTNDVEASIRSAFEKIDEARSKATSALDVAAGNKDSKAAQAATVTAYEEERKAIQATITTLNAEYNARQKIQDKFKQQGTSLASTPYGSAVQYNGLKDQTANLTLLGKSVQLAQQELRGLDLTMDNIGKNKAVDALRDQTSSMRAETKLAAAEWKNLEAEFTKYQTSILQSTGKKATPQQDLNFLVGKESSINPLNASKLQAKELPFRNQIADQTFGDEAIQKLADQASALTKYGEALKETTELDRIFQEAQKKHITLSDDQIDLLTITADYIQHNVDKQRALNSVYDQANNVQKNYNDFITAADQVAADHPELQSRIAQAVAKATQSYTDATQPLFEYSRGLEQQTELYGQYGIALQVSQEIQQVENQLRQQGITLSTQEEAQLRTTLTLLAQRNLIEAASRDLYDQTTGSLQKLAAQKVAVNNAATTELSNMAKQSQLARINNQINDSNLANGQATSQKSPFAGALADYVSNFTTAAKQIKQVYSDTFKTIADGIADSIGRAIVYADNLGDAFKDVARNAISQLISGLIKVGLQMLVLKAVTAIFGETETTSNTAAAATTAAAWAPAASLVSLATLGANAGPASAGIIATTAISETVAALSGIGIAGHKDGGLIVGAGTGRSDSNLRLLSHGEYVVNAAATSKNLDLLHAINSGGAQKGQTVQQTRSGSVGSSPQMKVVIEDHTSGVKFQKVQIGASEMRIIAQDAAEQAVSQHSDLAVANAVNNPNSKTSKALRTSTTARRQR